MTDSNLQELRKFREQVREQENDELGVYGDPQTKDDDDSMRDNDDTNQAIRPTPAVSRKRTTTPANTTMTDSNLQELRKFREQVREQENDELGVYGDPQIDDEMRDTNDTNDGPITIVEATRNHGVTAFRVGPNGPDGRPTTEGRMTDGWDDDKPFCESVSHEENR